MIEDAARRFSATLDFGAHDIRYVGYAQRRNRRTGEVSWVITVGIGPNTPEDIFPATFEGFHVVARPSLHVCLPVPVGEA
jgi:hypothetical protein